MTSDIKFMLVKAEKRARDEGKDTEFIQDGMGFPAETLQQVKRARLSGSGGELLLAAGK